MSDNIKVVVKVRPLISREIEEEHSYQWRVKNNTLYQLDQNGKDLGQSFTFDKVYDVNTKTSDVYDDIAKPIVQAATAGFNGTIFAYGQTSSGKTYTMTGTEESPGIIPLAVLNLFEIIKNLPDRDFLVRVSYIEIYNETVRDLLDVKKNNIRVLESHAGIKIEATEKVTSSPEEVLEYMKEGELNRQKGATNMNEESSRSHSIFQITIESREHTEDGDQGGCVNVSQLNLVDLAGSERAGQTGATGKRFTEGTYINKSLSALSLVIKQLSEDPNKFANYRDSKLTRILQNSLGGNAKTSIICAVTPAAVEETISTLQFANRAKAIKNKPEVNAVATDKTMIQRLTKQMSKLQEQLESKKNLEQDNYQLQMQIAALRRLILNSFNQPRNIEKVQGARKKLQMRRVTIHSTLSSSATDDEPITNIPKFCTPSLKYNPLSISNTSEFVTIPSSNKLASVQEEREQITPPPQQRTVNFNDEVIELDSDDDSAHGDQDTCSPIHRCYGATKTPPCKLRDMAKRAEKDLQDIVELTEREKLFPPDAVELMAKLEENSTVILQLRDEVDLLNRQSKEKDEEISLLNNKIKDNEVEKHALCSAKLKLETQCQNYNTKLTDWEVSYETLQNKAKLREDELLSLLEEVKNRKTQAIDKLSSQTMEKEINFMDMSNEITLVNSDTDNSVGNSSDLVENIGKEAVNLIYENKSVLELKNELFIHKQKITELENLNRELELNVSTIREKFSNLETENSLLKSTIDTLNTTIHDQKENIKSTETDIQSYNALIRDLQIRLTQRTNLSKINIDDSVLEHMIATEEKCIANNENMVNIIQCFKNAIHVRNNEIAELKAHANDDSEKESLLSQLKTKTDQISILDLEVIDLQKQIADNITLINRLKIENSNFITIEKELSEKLVHTENKYMELEKVISDNSLHILHLKSDYEKQKLEMHSKTEEFVKEIEALKNKITDLQESARQKDELMHRLNQEQQDSKENMLQAKNVVVKLQKILNTLSGDMQNVPEIIDNFVSIFSALSDSLDTLETIASDIMAEKYEENKIKKTLETELDLLQKKNTEVSNLLEQIRKNENDYNLEKEALIDANSKLKNDVDTLREELRCKISDIKILEGQLKEADNIRNATSSAKEKEIQQLLLEKQNMIDHLTEKLKVVSVKTEITEKALIDEQHNNSKTSGLLANIISKITELVDFLNIEECKVDLKDDGLHEQIILCLDNVRKHVHSLVNQKISLDECRNLTDILNEAKQNIAELSEKNSVLEEKLSEMEIRNHNLMSEVEKNEIDNKNLTVNLEDTQKILQFLQIELKRKAADLTSMEDKVQTWKEEFKSLDAVMKEQMSELEQENHQLKSRINELKKESEMSAQASEHNIDSLHNENQFKSSTNVSDLDIYTPPSLLTICCNKIVDYIEPRESESKTTILSSEPVCECIKLKLELEDAKEENVRIMDLLTDLEYVNQNLLKDQDILRHEIEILVKSTQELQKKIFNHKTNLSILTATTYAENKSVQSQVKGLQHHHKRLHNVCHRDISDFKKQLNSLSTVLKGTTPECDTQNNSFKRYSLPDVLDNSTAVCNFKNESTLDGDLLMLDTNITITTAADNTLMGNDQTCLDVTQYYREASCQTNDFNHMIVQNGNNQNDDMFEKINVLTEENSRLRKVIDNLSIMKQSSTETHNSQKANDKITTLTSDNVFNQCIKCAELLPLKQLNQKLNDELKELHEKLRDIILKKDELEQKYNNVVLEIPNTETLVKKITTFEKEYNNQKQEINMLNNTLSSKLKELKSLQEENDSLSNQIMENITESDNLNKELENLKLKNKELTEKCVKLEQSASGRTLAETNCSESKPKEELLEIQSKETKGHPKLNRSLSDSASSSRYNKICTLQSELHAGREDCKELTEDVVTIKNHLERSNMSMDLDESLSDINNYTRTKEFEVSSPQSSKCIMPDIPEEDIYLIDKVECLNYYNEITGARRVSNQVPKIIEIMRMLYENLTTKHGNEVENLTNKLKDYEEDKNFLKSQSSKLLEKMTEINRELDEKNKKYSDVADTLSLIRNNIKRINESLSSKDMKELISIFQDNLTLLDGEFSLTSRDTFKSLIDNIMQKYETDLSTIMQKYTDLKQTVETVNAELNSVNGKLLNMKMQLDAKEEEYNLLKAQKQRVQEISNAVTIDIVKREKELKDTIDNGYKKLIELNLIKPDEVNTDLPANKNINILLDLLIAQNNTLNNDKENEKDVLLKEINNLKSTIENKEQEIELLTTRNEKLQEFNNRLTLNLNEKDKKLEEINSLYENTNNTFESNIEKEKENIIQINKLTKEVNELKASITSKEETILRLGYEMAQDKCNGEFKLSQLKETVQDLQNNNAKLKSINEIIIKERDKYAEELQKSSETIKNNNIDLDKMTSDILVLRESAKENIAVIESLRAEAKSLFSQNIELKEQLEIKTKEFSRLETNIKTHEKTAQIQTRMIMRLEKQKTEDDKVLNETKQQLEELSQRYTTQQTEIQTYKTKVEQLEILKQTLEARISELEATSEPQRSRQSIDAFGDVVTRRRRQSLHDSKRVLGDDRHDLIDHANLEAVFDSRPKPDDLFMDVEEQTSNRSTPIRLSKGRDSFSLSRTDQSDKDEEQPSRPSSVLETRRRRQTIHDSHRNELSHTPSPCNGNDSTVSLLKERLASCQQELDELKEKYRELDEECETCAEYLRESEKQCAKLKKEKLSLQNTITELNASKPAVAHASVNTDEDWANLHSVVVDRMSFDAEVEKNKKLTKTIEELRFKKQDLKNTLSKMQKALEKNGGLRELEMTKMELQASKQELSQLKERYKELDEECETCAQYLREKEAECRRLKDAKNALEAKLQQLQDEVSPPSHTSRKKQARDKRQSAHDQNRSSVVDVADATTETSDDFLSYVVERDGNTQLPNEKNAKEVKHLKMVIEKMSQQKLVLEHQLVTMSAMHAQQPAMYVATGSAIVQNQQITDVMKENQKLKKINAKLINICKKRSKESNRENEDPADLN